MDVINTNVLMSIVLMINIYDDDNNNNDSIEIKCFVHVYIFQGTY
jgi:hypothetical protein